MSEIPLPTSLNEKFPLQRLKSNDSTTSSTFSRNSSSSSVATTISTHNFQPSSSYKPIVSPTLSSLTDALHISFGHNGNKSSDTLNVEDKQTRDFAPTTTPTNEEVITQKWCIILVGLPASGKSTITSNLINYLKPYYHIDTFNAGFIRRKLSIGKQNANFFDFNNPKAKKQRDTYAQISLDHLLNSLFCDNLDVGILDATNSTKDRRDYIFNTINDKKKYYESNSNIQINTMVLEIKCEDPKCWEFNAKKKTTNPDYITMGYEKALKDFMDRAQRYRDAFEEITKEEMLQNGGLYIQFKDVGKKIEIDGEENYLNEDEDEILKLIMKFMNDYYENFGEKYMNLVYGN